MRRLSLRRLLSLFIAFQLAATPFATNYVSAADENGKDTRSQIEKQLSNLTKEGSELPEAQVAMARAENLALEIENASERDLPKSTPNAFFLAKQTLTIKDDSYNLSRFNLDLPTITVNDFEKEISIEVNRSEKTISFVKYKGDTEVARHTISGLDIVTFSQDKELLQMVDASGRIYAIDLAFTSSRLVLFRTPIPVFTVGTLPDTFKSEIESLDSAFITRGLKPPTRVHPEALIPITDQNLFEKSTNNSALSIKLNGQWKAGSFILFNERNNRELTGIYARETTLSAVQLGFGILHSLAYAISPEGQADSAISNLNNSQTAQTISQISNKMDESTRDAFTAYTPEVISQLVTRTGMISAHANDKKDKFLFDEWQSEFKNLHTKATSESSTDELKLAAQKGDLGKHVNDLIKNQETDIKKSEKKMFDRLVTKKGLKTIAAITAGYTALIATHLYGGQLVDGHGPAWAVHAAMSLYDILPEVLKDAAYRVTMFKGAHFLGSFILVNYTIGSLVGKAKGWDFKKALAVMGTRIAAQIQFSFLARLAQLTRQPTFITALRSGANPFARIRKDSAVGEAINLTADLRPGIVNPFASASKFKTDIEKKRAVLEAKIAVDRRRQATAALLANLVIAEKFGIDPVTLLMAQKGELDGENLDKLDAEIKRIKTNPVLLEKWMRLSREVYFSLKGLNDFKDDISKIKKERLVEFYEIAKNTAEKISNRSKFASVAANLKTKWQEISQGRGLKAIGNFGHSEYEFLKNVDPSKFVSEQTWEQFLADFYLTVIQIPLVGDRANVNMPHELAHQEGRFGWTSSGHLADMGNQYAIYGISVPARMSQVYGDQAILVREDRYDPVEQLTLQSITKPEGFMRGMWSWMKGAGNLKDAGYGFIFVKDFKRRLKAIQLTFTMDIFCRLFIAGQAASAAFPAFAYSLLMAEWSYAWFWKPVTRGNQIYKDGLTKTNDEFMDAKIKISQGIRLKDDTLWREGFNKLLSIYNEHSSIEESTSRLIDKLEILLSIPKEEQLSTQDIKNMPFTLTLKLRSAIQSRDKAKIKSSYEELKLVYKKDGYELSSLDAQELLEFSLQNPPFYNATNSKVSNMTNIAASLVTTYLGTNLFVDLLRDHSWSDKITEGAIISLSLYALVYNLQKGINNLSATTEYIRLRETLPLEAFKIAEKRRPQVSSLKEYAKWIKEQPETSQLIREASIEDITRVLSEEIHANVFGERGMLTKINSRQKPSVAEIKNCAALLSQKSIRPMTWGEKINVLIKGTFNPPTKQ